MTVTVYGVDGSMTEARWAELHALVTPQIVSGMKATVATGTRVISVTTGSAVGAGVLVKSDAATTVTLDPNATGNDRFDYIVAKVDWSGVGGTGTVTFVKGTAAASPVAPALTQTAGTLWHIPIARVRVRNGVGQIADADLEDARPGPRVATASSKVVSGRTLNKNNANILCETLSIADPGWDYRIVASGWVELADAADGHTTFNVQVNGTDVTEGRSGNGNAARAALVGRASSVLSGASSVTLLASPFNATVNPVVENGQLNALILPA